MEAFISVNGNFNRTLFSFFCLLIQPMLVGSGTTSVAPNNENIASGEDHK